jgi:hypothetical protein
LLKGVVPGVCFVDPGIIFDVAEAEGRVFYDRIFWEVGNTFLHDE